MCAVIGDSKPLSIARERQPIGLIDARMAQLEFRDRLKADRMARCPAIERNRAGLEIAHGNIALVRRYEGHAIGKCQFRFRPDDLEGALGTIAAPARILFVNGDGAAALRYRQQLSAGGERNLVWISQARVRAADRAVRTILEQTVRLSPKQQNRVVFGGCDPQDVARGGQTDAFKSLCRLQRGDQLNKRRIWVDRELRITHTNP